jgi:uncharacterized repeat protein (TIGR03803 family)
LDTSGNFTVLHTLVGGIDGAYPECALVFDSKGNLYGTTQAGGTYGYGTVFELSPQSGGAWSETILYSFCSLSGCADGKFPGWGALVMDSAGNLYGVTSAGGSYQNCGFSGDDVCGVVFKLDSTGKETVLHNFSGGADGAAPLAGLTMDAAGNLYGVTYEGGDLNCRGKRYTIGCGTLFKITP